MIPEEALVRVFIHVKEDTGLSDQNLLRTLSNIRTVSKEWRDALDASKRAYVCKICAEVCFGDRRMFCNACINLDCTCRECRTRRLT